MKNTAGQDQRTMRIMGFGVLLAAIAAVLCYELHASLLWRFISLAAVVLPLVILLVRPRISTNSAEGSNDSL